MSYLAINAGLFLFVFYRLNKRAQFFNCCLNRSRASHVYNTLCILKPVLNHEILFFGIVAAEIKNCLKSLAFRRI